MMYSLTSSAPCEEIGDIIGPPQFSLLTSDPSKMPYYKMALKLFHLNPPFPGSYHPQPSDLWRILSQNFSPFPSL